MKNMFKATIVCFLSFFMPYALAADPVIPPDPVPDALYPNVFYGATPDSPDLPPDIGDTAPVLVFIPGLSGTAMNWWTNNDMYWAAYTTGLRTAFISLNADNSPNKESIETNAETLKVLVPHIADHFNIDKMYIVGHSKGGVDMQAAMLDPNIADQIKGVFTISSPNQGSELADWAVANPVLAELLGLLNPAIESLTTENMGAFRSDVDPILRAYGTPFFTIAGEKYEGNALTEFTGRILELLVPGVLKDTNNDGFVTVARARLPEDYSADMGTVPNNHLETDSGKVSFAKIWGRIQGIERTYSELEKVASGGFFDQGGSIHNTWIWSAKWFKDKLYVGTGREINCLSVLIADVNTGTSFYPKQVISGQCPDTGTLVDQVGAEIWQFTPDTDTWVRVFKSPNSVPIAFDDSGNPTIFTARDVGFRGMEVHIESDGTEALYVGGVTSGSVFDPLPFKEQGFPPPRLLRSIDGVTWEPVPQDPGTFLGEIGNVLADPVTRFRAFRSLKSYKGKLFITASDFVGSGVILASENPAQGNDAWQQVSATRDEFPVWTLTVFNDFLYATTGLTQQQDPSNPGYGVHKTAAEGDPPYSFAPVVVNGGEQSDGDYRSPNGLSFAEFKGQLYLGTNRPTELIRIDKDDSWELIVGEPRTTPEGEYKAPLSGFSVGFGSIFNGHFWRMASYGDNLYLGTWGWSSAVQGNTLMEALDRLFTSQHGFDFFRTDDGTHWTALSRTGLGFPNSTGVRSLEPTPVGLFMGTAGEDRQGAQIYRTMGPESDTVIDSPTRLKAASELSVGQNVELSWDAIAGADRYRIYRVPLMPFADVFSSSAQTTTVTVVTALERALESVAKIRCDEMVGDTTVCTEGELLGQSEIQAAVDEPTSLVFPKPYTLVAVTSETTFSEPSLSNSHQSIYFVKAEDADGNLSFPSNIVAAPSKAEPVSDIPGDIDGDGDVDSDDVNLVIAARNTPATGPDDPRDMDGDGMITIADARLIVLQCTRPSCSTN